MSSNKIAGIAAISGGLAVMLGAFGAHGLKDKVTAEALDIWNTGAHYHFVMSVALLAVALWDVEKKLQLVQKLWIAGIIIFSGSLYALTLSGVKMLGAITPIGGVCLILGWLILGWKLVKG